MIINVKESESERMERMLRTLNKRGAENYEKRRQQTIERERKERAEAMKAEKERIEKEKIRKYIQELKEKERIEAEKKEREERKQKIVDRIGVTFGIVLIVGGIIVFNVKVFDSFAQFFYFLKVIAVLIGVMIAFGIVGLIGALFGIDDSSSIHYTKPHHYVVTDENKDKYTVYREKDTTTFVTKR